MTEAIVAPVGPPSVFDDPDIGFLDVGPANYFDDVVAFQLETIAGALVHAVAVCQEVRVGLEHCDHWTVFENFLFDAKNSLSKTVVNNSEKVLILSANVL